MPDLPLGQADVDFFTATIGIVSLIAAAPEAAVAGGATASYYGLHQVGGRLTLWGLEQQGAGAGLVVAGGAAAASSASRQPCPPNMTRVGRWMSPAEYQKMNSTKQVQFPLNGAGATHVTVPPNPGGFTPSKGSLFVEFDVNSAQVRIHDPSKGWGRVFGPNSLEARLAAKKGLDIPVGPPAANNIFLKE